MIFLVARFLTSENTDGLVRRFSAFNVHLGTFLVLGNDFSFLRRQ